MSQLSASTLRIYGRELARCAEFGIKLEKVKSIPALYKKIISTYKRHSIPFENLRLCLFAIRNHLKGRRSSAWAAMLSKESIGSLRDSYTGGAIKEEKDNDATHITWDTIVARTRPFLENRDNNPIERLLVALYTLIPPRRSDYHTLEWSDECSSGNQLTERGEMCLHEYKTARTYGPYRVDFSQDGTFHGPAESQLFMNIINDINPEDRHGRIFKGRSGSYSMTSFAGLVDRVFSRIVGQKVSILDLRRSFDNWVRLKLASPRLSQELRGNLYKAVEMATAHSRSMSDFYADKVSV
jgi:hypothetical protein